MKKNNLYKNFFFLFFLLCSGLNALGLEGNFIQGGLVFGKLDQEGKVFFESVYNVQKKRIFHALKNSNSDSVIKFKEVLKRIIDGK